MLSYRHGFHAGNHADVLKHVVLLAVLDHLLEKDKPFWYVDTHAGAGLYDLEDRFARTNAEHAGGIARFWAPDARPLPVAIERYVAAVRALNPDGVLRHYPGSPMLARASLREGDRLRLFERHPSDLDALRRTMSGAGRQVIVSDADGPESLKALLPPPPRRAVILMDPSYELTGDYDQVIDALGEARRRFASGVYLVWYPVLARQQARALPQRLRRLAWGPWLRVELDVCAPARGGMTGSGVFVLNPPWTLHAMLSEAMPVLVERLGDGAGAGFRLHRGEAADSGGDERPGDGGAGGRRRPAYNRRAHR